MKKVNFIRYALFCAGLGIALASSLILFGALYINASGKPVVFYEPNTTFALLEMMGLALAVANCSIAVEIYWKYLKLKEMIYIEK